MFIWTDASLWCFGNCWHEMVRNREFVIHVRPCWCPHDNQRCLTVTGSQIPLIIRDMWQRVCLPHCKLPSLAIKVCGYQLTRQDCQDRDRQKILVFAIRSPVHSSAICPYVNGIFVRCFYQPDLLRIFFYNFCNFFFFFFFDSLNKNETLVFYVQSFFCHILCFSSSKGFMFRILVYLLTFALIAAVVSGTFWCFSSAHSVALPE